MVVEDHKMLQEGLRVMLDGSEELFIAASFDTLSEALSHLGEIDPRVAVVDMMLPDGNGAEVIRSCKTVACACAVVALSMHVTAEHVYAAFRAGADAYVSKASASRTLLEAIDSALRGELYADGATAATLIEHLDERPPQPVIHDAGYESLSGREREVFRLIAEGCSTKEVAHRLRVSPKTVEAHRAGIYAKLEVSSPVEIARYASRIGVV